MRFLGANRRAMVRGLDPLPGRSHYLRGPDRERWIRHVPHFAKVEYEEIYPGIDLVFREGRGEQLEYDFVVSPGAGPGRIRMSFPGADEVSLDGDGNLAVREGDAAVVHRAPYCYQPADGDDTMVAGRFVLSRGGRVGFIVADFDPTLPLVIDPLFISYSSYLGGSSESTAFQDQGEGIHSVAVDHGGAAYVVGETTSLFGFPVSPGGFQPVRDDRAEAFVTKISPDGSTLEYSTFLGGDWADWASDVAVAPSGEAIVVGTTTSTNFPVSPGALKPSISGGIDAFVTRLLADGSDVVFSTHYGGGFFDYGFGVALDPAGDIYF